MNGWASPIQVLVLKGSTLRRTYQIGNLTVGTTSVGSPAIYTFQFVVDEPPAVATSDIFVQFFDDPKIQQIGKESFGFVRVLEEGAPNLEVHIRLGSCGPQIMLLEDGISNHCVAGDLTMMY